MEDIWGFIMWLLDFFGYFVRLGFLNRFWRFWGVVGYWVFFVGKGLEE